MTSHRPEVVFRGRRMPGDRALVMAIVNRTPDSFYDKGATFAEHAARDAVDRAVAAGADIVDIGGVKAGEGPEVDVETEIGERRADDLGAHPAAAAQAALLIRLDGHARLPTFRAT